MQNCSLPPKAISFMSSRFRILKLRSNLAHLNFRTNRKVATFFTSSILFLGLSNSSFAQTSSFTSTGSYTVPAGVSIITIECWGAGGGGGNQSSNGQAGGGGGGAYSSSQISVTPGMVYAVTVGAAGTSGTSGGDTYVTLTGAPSVTVSANGGSSGTNNSTSGATGGLASNGIGTIRYSGGNGGNAGSGNSGGGGGVAGSTGDGGNASGSIGGTGTPTLVGSGGNGANGVSGNNNGRTGNTYGGGGSGASYSSSNKTGGSGSKGYAKITVVSWCPPVFTSSITNTSCPLISDGAIAVSNNVDPAVEFRKTEYDYIDLNSSLLNNLSQFTIEGWTKFNLADVVGSRVGGVFGQNDCIEFGFYDANTIQCWTTGGGSIDVSTSFYPYDGAWHHIAAVGDGTQILIYIDGALVGTQAYITSNYGISAYTTKIGGRIWDDTDGGSFTGQIKKVGFWSTALTQAQIQTLASSYYIYQATDANLIAGYNFFEGTGTSLSSLPAGATGTFHYTPIWANVLTYAWTKTGDGTFSRTTPNLSGISTGEYNLTISNGSCNKSNSFTVNSNNTCATYWKGTTDTIWNKTTNWTAQYVPPTGANVEFATIANSGSAAVNNLALDVSRTIGSLTNLSSKRLFIPAGKCLTVNSTITTNNDPNQIYIQSSSAGGGNGSLIFHNAYGSPVQATVEMYSIASWTLVNPVGAKYKWQFFGIPLRSIATTSPTFDGAYVRQLHENDTPAHWEQLSNTSGLTSFTGYELTQAAAKTYVFQGQLENSDYSATLPYTSGASYPGQSLIGNPYTSAISISKIVFGSKMLKTVYIYNTGSLVDWQNAGSGNSSDSINTNTTPGQYTAVPQAQAGNAGLQHQIPSMQAFLVRAQSNDANATIYIPYSVASTVVADSVPQRVSAMHSSAAASAKVWTRIDVAGTRFADKMWIFTEPYCSHSFDNGWDSEKFLGSALAPQIYSMETDGDYQVNSVDNMNNTYIGFQTGEDSIYTMTFSNQNLGLKYTNVYLVDSVSKKTVDVTDSGATYTFKTLPTDTIIKRFKIVTILNTVTDPNPPTGITTPTADDSTIKVFNSLQTLFIDNKTNENGFILLYDIAGRFIARYQFAGNEVTTFQTGLSPGSYIAKAVTNSLKVTKQLLIN